MIHAVHTESEEEEEEEEEVVVDKSEEVGGDGGGWWWGWRSWFMSSTELGWSCACSVSAMDWMWGWRTVEEMDDQELEAPAISPTTSVE